MTEPIRHARLWEDPSEPVALRGPRRAPKTADWALAIIALTATLSTTAAATSLGGGRVGAMVFAGTAFLTGSYCAVRLPSAHLSYVVAIWLLAPLVRRVTDWVDLEFSEQSPASLAPYLASAACVLGLTNRRRFIPRHIASALLVTHSVLAVAWLFGSVFNGVSAATLAFLEWSSPILVMSYALSMVPGLRVLVIRLALATCITVGSYGVFQYFHPPKWDLFWIEAAPINSVGEAVAGGFRVFSTLNSPGPMAMVVALAMLLLMASRSTGYAMLSLLAMPALALSLVRSAWLVVVIGIAVLTLGRASSWQSRASGAVVSLGLVALAATFPVATVSDVANRLETTASLSDDTSFQARLAFTQDFLAQAVNPIGHGLGSSGVSARLTSESSAPSLIAFDNGLLNVPYTLGSLGFVAFIYAFVRLRRHAYETLADPPSALGGLVAVALLGLAFTNVLTGVTGIFVGLLYSAWAGDQR